MVIKALLARFTRRILLDDIRSYEVAEEAAEVRLRIERANLAMARKRLDEFDRQMNAVSPLVSR